MDDENILGQINGLAAEEHALFERESRGNATDDDRGRLKQIGVTLDQCWDLLRQRRAKRSAGRDPDDATLRDAGTVEQYLG